MDPNVSACAVGRVNVVTPSGVPEGDAVKLLVKVCTVDGVPIAGDTEIKTFVFVAG